MISYGSVCSGIEAATAAWHPLGWRAAWFSAGAHRHGVARPQNHFSIECRSKIMTTQENKPAHPVSDDEVREAIGHYKAYMRRGFELLKKDEESPEAHDAGLCFNEADTYAETVIRAALSTPDTRQAVREWMPIESAPRDGRKILLYWPYWQISHAVVGHFFDGGWESAEANTHYHEGMFPDRNPVAWRDLPTPPTKSEG